MKSAPVLAALFSLACADRAWTQVQSNPALSFFITSVGMGKGANLGGLAGADAHCQKLAEAVGAGKREWRAYLSRQAVNGAAAVNAKDRIGAGPWFNAKGLQVAANIADLHSKNNKLSKENSLTETGNAVPGRGDAVNQHDMLTGTHADGTAYDAAADMTCSNWSSETTGKAMLGHHDRHGVAGNIDSTSWNEAHASSGCSQANLVSTGGAGYFYCFAADAATGLSRGGMEGAADGRISLSGFAMLWDGAPWNRSMDFPAAGEAVLTLFTLEGTRIAEASSGGVSPGTHTLHWNGLDNLGRTVPRGFYLIRVMLVLEEK